MQTRSMLSAVSVFMVEERRWEYQEFELCIKLQIEAYMPTIACVYFYYLLIVSL